MIMEIENNQKPLLSVICTTYNHESYIAHAIDSIIMQEVNFCYEIVIGEDCSTDETRRILLNYKKRYPDKIVLVLHDKNIGMRANEIFVRDLCRGKYLAYLEGDDYWSDKYKIQKQVDFLEAHSEYIGVAHNVKVIDQNGNRIIQPSKSVLSNRKSYIYTLKDTEDFMMCGHLSTRVIRNIFKQIDVSVIEKYDDCDIIGDWKHSMLLSLLGNLYYLEDEMSVYRQVLSGDKNWSAKNKKKMTPLYYCDCILKMKQFAKNAFFVNLNMDEAYNKFARKAFGRYIRKTHMESRIELSEIWRRCENRKLMLWDIVTFIPFYAMKKIISRIWR